MNLFIVGNIGKFNVGDDAILVAFLKWLNERSDEKFNAYTCTKNDYLLSDLRGLQRVKVRMVFGIGLLRAFFSSRCVLICGGDYLDDFGSFSTRLREFVLLFSLAFVSKVGLKKFLMINNGIRANSHLGLSFERLVLRLASCVSVRDVASYDLVYRYKRVTKGFDTAVLWKSVIPNITETKVSHKCGIKKVGFSISPFFSNFFSNSEKDKQFAKKIARSLKDLLSLRNDVEINFIAYNTSRESGDQYIIKHIVRVLGSGYKDRLKVTVYDGNILNFLQKLSQMDVMVCCKYHSILFSYILRKPMLVIKYHPKTLALARDIGLSSKALMSVNDVFKGELGVKMPQLLSNSLDFESTLPISTAENKAISGFQVCLRVLQNESP